MSKNCHGNITTTITIIEHIDSGEMPKTALFRRHVLGATIEI